ncbi:MAG: phosphate acyltransferase PlsX, partial [Sinobacterium sp.]|nr:phosphate acyltransferase PlsX [Sinobacterium sp.]
MAQAALAIDAMSGDFGPRVLIPSILRFLAQYSHLRVYVVGQKSVIEPIIQRTRLVKKSKVLARLDIVDAPDVIGMDEKPAQVLRSKKQSSMHVAIDLVANNKATAIISAGNTGALMALSMHKLKRVPGIHRPAICGLLPTLDSHSYLLDMGANVDVSAKELLQFSQMANVLSKTIDGKESPRIALLNIGEEALKGNSQVQEAAELLKTEQSLHGMNYVGFIEAHKLYDGIADVIVCDGFVGNIALKASEGVASYMLERVRQEFRTDWVFRLLSIFAVPQFLRIKSRIDPRRFNGAILLGINGIVVKSHGHADEEAFFHALEHAQQMMQCG